MRLDPYSLWHRLLPGFKPGHTVYVEYIKTNFPDGCRWLDAGGGRHIFPDLCEGERELVQRSRMVVVCDGDFLSLKGHVSVCNLIACDLARIPLPSHSMDLITCAMVVEHLSEPSACLGELARILSKGGKLVIHTPNLWGYPVILATLSKVIPYPLRKRLIAQVTGRSEQDIFPTRYKCNTAGKITRLLKNNGLEIQEVNHLHEGFLFPSMLPLYVLELLYKKLTSLSSLQQLRGQLLITATKL
jgi:SAM-dependent methyltransferase